MKETVRAFIAFELPEAIIALAATLQARLKAHGLKLEWVRPENIHLTMKFLGEVDRSRLSDVGAAMQSAARRAVPMDVTAQGIGVFPGLRKPRVLWFGLGGRIDLLGESHRCLENDLAEKGFPRDQRPFKAHLTLARIKQGVDSGRLLEGMATAGGYDPVSFRLTEWVLFRSELRSRGAVYTALERVALAGEA